MIDLNIQLPEHFLEGEVRCGYYIAPAMKKAWAVQMDLLMELDRVCRKYKIRYFVAEGTILGAVRHKGFIPWDDDIDCCMTHSEYKKLCKIGPKAFRHPYFFQTEYTDPGSLRGHAQLRHSLTTGMLKDEIPFKYKFNQGIFIDIFVLDHVTDNKALFEKQKKRCERLWEDFFHAAHFTTRYYPISNPVKNAGKSVFKFLLGGPLKPVYNEFKFYRIYEKEWQRYNNEETKYMSFLSYSCGNSRNFRRSTCFDDVVYLDFEFLKVPVPSGYEDYLDDAYGNWHEFVLNTQFHSSIYFDCDHPYTDYLEGLREVVWEEYGHVVEDPAAKE